jgi:hypothetical protein
MNETYNNKDPEIPAVFKINWTNRKNRSLRFDGPWGVHPMDGGRFVRRLGVIRHRDGCRRTIAIEGNWMVGVRFDFLESPR